MTRIIFLNVAWMKKYEGLRDVKPVRGGNYIAEEGWGGGIYNFRCFNGKMYGFAQAQHQTIEATRLGAPRDADRATDILVIWMATQPEGGRRIVGRYDHATAFRKPQDSFSGADRRLPR